jgi:hypothetical protein
MRLKKAPTESELCDPVRPVGRLTHLCDLYAAGVGFRAPSPSRLPRTA